MKREFIASVACSFASANRLLFKMGKEKSTGFKEKTSNPVRWWIAEPLLPDRNGLCMECSKDNRDGKPDQSCRSEWSNFMSEWLMI